MIQYFKTGSVIFHPKYILFILLFTSSLSLFGQSAIVNKTWLEYNVVKGGDKGMTIHADIDVKGCTLGLSPCTQNRHL